MRGPGPSSSPPPPPRPRIAARFGEFRRVSSISTSSPLSWSPGFCQASGDVKGLGQCDAGSGLGFVVHGLWPQNDEGYPIYCEPGGRFVSRPAIAEARGVFPDEGLARYTWRKHGSCSGASPADYFRSVREARERVPDPGSPAAAGRQRESAAARDRAGLRRGQSGSAARDDGCRLRAARVSGDTDLPRQGPARLSPMSRCRPVRLPRRGDHGPGRAVASP